MQSLSSKYEKLKNLIQTLGINRLSVDIIALQETWTIKYPQLLTIPGYQNLFYLNRQKGRGGGVGFFVKNGLNAKVIYECNNDKIFEAISLEIMYSQGNTNKRYIVTSIYRSPSSVQGITQADQLDRFNDKLDNLLTDLNSRNLDSYVFLDSNLNLLNLTNNPNASTYLTNITNAGFLLANFRATRMQNGSSSLIDHILTNNKSTHLTSGTIIGDISDHFLTFLQPDLQKYRSKPKVIKRRLYNKNNLDKFKIDLQRLSWDDVLETEDVDTCYEKFWGHYSRLHDLHFPLTASKFNKNYHKISDFMTPGLLISRSTKLKLHKIALTDNVPYNWSEYRKYRNIFNKTVRASKKLYYMNNIVKNAKNPKKTWDILRELTTGKTEKNQIDKIKVNDKIITEPTCMANEFNNFFTRVGRNIANSVGLTSVKPADYLPKTSPPPLRLDEVSQHQVVDIISAMESKSSTDASGINTKMLKFIKYQISKPLSHLFTLSVTTGVFPTKLKVSKTIPIFKAGERTSCDNYRPISLLSAISKILEKIVANSLVNHLEINKLLYENQYGFLRGRSTVHNITKLTNRISHDLNEKKFVIGVFLDIKKAFDSVSHKILLDKLKHLGITDTVLKWFTSYLSDRKQFTEIDGSKSSNQIIDISVLQGSILGPILFLCFINDLNLSTELLTLLFADDTAIVDSDSDINILINRVNCELQKVANWFRANQLAVNVNKTKYIIFRPKGTKINIDLQSNGVVFNSNEIGAPTDPSKIFKLGRICNENENKLDRTYKFLGILLDEYLTFNDHCELICKKLAKSNFIISRVKNILPESSLKTLYYALVHPHLLYGLSIYSCTTQKNIQNIYRMQKKAIRLITKSRYNDPPYPLFDKLKILPFEYLITLSGGLLVHSILHKYSPSSLHNTWLTNEQRGTNHDLRNAHHLYIPFARTDQVKRLSFFSLPKLWNELPDCKLTPNPITFKIALKWHLFNLIKANPL